MEASADKLGGRLSREFFYIECSNPGYIYIKACPLNQMVKHQQHTSKSKTSLKIRVKFTPIVNNIGMNILIILVFDVVGSMIDDHCIVHGEFDNFDKLSIT